MRPKTSDKLSVNIDLVYYAGRRYAENNLYLGVGRLCHLFTTVSQMLEYHLLLDRNNDKKTPKTNNLQ